MATHTRYKSPGAVTADADGTPRDGARAQSSVPVERRDAVGVDETAHLLGVSRRTIYDLLASGELESIKLRSRRLIPRRARERLLERLLAEGRMETTRGASL